MSLYSWIIIFSFAGPLLLSFDKKVAFYRDFIKGFIAIVLIAVPFLVWDNYFTINKIWGFNPDYLLGICIYSLPLEECLFFLVVPFACLFIHQVLKAYFPSMKFEVLTKLFAWYFSVSGILLAVFYHENWYTCVACLTASLLTFGFYFIRRTAWFSHFAFTYIVVLIPFILVNGILTGAVTPQPVVWYNEEHIIGIRIITIPFEDLYYNYALLLPIVGIFEALSKYKN